MGTSIAAGEPAGPDAGSFSELYARRRGRLRRYFHEHPRVMDLVVVAGYLLLASSTAVPTLLRGLWLPAGLTVLTAGALAFRRRNPVAVLAAVAVFELCQTLVYPWGGNTAVGLWFALYAVAVVRGGRLSFAATAAATLPLVVFFLFFLGPPPDSLRMEMPATIGAAAAATVLLSNVVATGVGVTVRHNREHDRQLQEWAVRNAELASATERNRIAREMHDVVAHSLTVMIALSDGAAAAATRSPDRAAEALAELSRTGRAALADMRRVLGVLRSADDAGAPRRPVAAPLDLAALLDGFRAAGLPLHVRYGGPDLPADPAFQLTVYRIVQESLTNVLRYGRHVRRVEVDISRAGNTVSIRVSDDGEAAAAAGTVAAGPLVGTGQGIVGMRERASIYGGTVDCGPGPGGGWLVTAVLHWPQEAAADGAAAPPAVSAPASSRNPGGTE